MNFFYGDKTRPLRAYGAEIGVYVCSTDLSMLLKDIAESSFRDALVSGGSTSTDKPSKIPGLYELRSESTEIVQGILIDKSYDIMIDQASFSDSDIQSFTKDTINILDILNENDVAIAWIQGLKSSALAANVSSIEDLQIETTRLQETEIISNVYIDDELLDDYQYQWSEAEESISGTRVLLVEKKHGSIKVLRTID